MLIPTVVRTGDGVVCVCGCGGGGGYIHYLHSLRGTKSVWYLWCLVANPYVEVMLSREEVP